MQAGLEELLRDGPPHAEFGGKEVALCALEHVRERVHRVVEVGQLEYDDCSEFVRKTIPDSFQLYPSLLDLNVFYTKN